ncbi:MAG: GAF domain-containing protein [Deltaproteobacteria bacterium]|nr:GAF domain-containing protein [Deltaproteobacteria bacterium]
MPKSVVTVHHRGDRGVDGILRLIELAGHDGPLETMLTAMCDELAAITGVDIASVYVREDDQLIMRGNHGFPPAAIGTVLAVGQGITGLVAECMRPVSAAHAAAEAAYKHVPGLGEERFPVFVGIPLISGGAVMGVLVLQRRKTPFAADEVTLATALGAPITLAIERRRASAVRSARLHGVGHGGAIVLGRAGIVPTTTALAAAGALTPDDVDRALGRLRDDLGRALKKLVDLDHAAGALEAAAAGNALDRFALALADQRLRERLVAAVGEPSGLRAAVRDYARAPIRLGTSGDHAADIEELCALIGVTCDDKASLRPGAVWIGDTLGAFVAIAAVARGASALVAAHTATPAAIAIARAAHLPIASDVSGVFSWARPGDLLAVDGASGTVLVHPAPTDIEKLRAERDR